VSLKQAILMQEQSELEELLCCQPDADDVANDESYDQKVQAADRLAEIYDELDELMNDDDDDDDRDDAVGAEGGDVGGGDRGSGGELRSGSGGGNSKKERKESKREVRAKEILKGLQFTDGMLSKVVNELSGGWRMRLALAKVKKMMMMMMMVMMMPEV
jgi:ATPase subunit of ABC transporter with duplicated ATPase domains